MAIDLLLAVKASLSPYKFKIIFGKNLLIRSKQDERFSYFGFPHCPTSSPSLAILTSSLWPSWRQKDSNLINSIVQVMLSFQAHTLLCAQNHFKYRLVSAIFPRSKMKSGCALTNCSEWKCSQTMDRQHDRWKQGLCFAAAMLNDTWSGRLG